MQKIMREKGKTISILKESWIVANDGRGTSTGGVASRIRTKNVYIFCCIRFVYVVVMMNR